MLLQPRSQGPLSTSRVDPGNEVGAPPSYGLLLIMIDLFCLIQDRPVLLGSHLFICHVVSSSQSISTCLTCFLFCFVYPSDTFKDFKSEFHRLFPLIHDTKFIAFEIRRNPVSPCGNT